VILNFLKKYFTQIVLVIIAIALVLLAVTSLGTFSLDNQVEVDSYISIVKTLSQEIGQWGMMFLLAGGLLYAFLTGANSQHTQEQMVSFRQTPTFNNLEKRYTKLPDEVKSAVEAVQSGVRVLNAFLDAPALEALEDMIEDLQTEEEGSADK
jgi:hypothetical protein